MNCLLCPIANNHANLDEDATDVRFPGVIPADNAADAFRHCYWSALMTIGMGKALAKLFGDMYEALTSSSEEQEAAIAMDKHNNSVGCSIGENAPNYDAANGRCYEESGGAGALQITPRI